MRQFLLSLVITCSYAVYGQVPNQIGARANGLANTTLMNVDVWAAKNNIGALGMLEQTEIGLTYQNRFLLSEFSNQTVAFNYHTNNVGNFSVYAQQTGFNLYRQLQSSLGYSMKLGKNISGGVAFNYHRVAFGDVYGSTNGFSASLGLFYSLNDNVEFGFNVLNLNRAKFDDYQDERFPTVFNLGMKYKFNEGTAWSIEAEKDLLHPINIKSGLEIKAHDILQVRLGMNSYPFQAAMGVGIKLKQFNLNLASSWHTNLGLNPSAGLVYQFK